MVQRVQNELLAGSRSLSLNRWMSQLDLGNMTGGIKGQLISKANCKAVNSSKKRTNDFVICYYATCFRSFFGRN